MRVISKSRSPASAFISGAIFMKFGRAPATIASRIGVPGVVTSRCALRFCAIVTDTIIVCGWIWRGEREELPQDEDPGDALHGSGNTAISLRLLDGCVIARGTAVDPPRLKGEEVPLQIMRQPEAPAVRSRQTLGISAMR